MVNNYKPDEFDALAAKRNTDGAHREVGPRRTWLWALIAVLVLAPLIGIGVANIVGNSDTVTQSKLVSGKEKPAKESSQNQQDQQAKASGVESNQDDTDVNQTTESEPEPEVDVNTEIRVLNGAGIQGLAGRAVETLSTAGFVNATSGNYTAAQPQGSAIFYSSSDEQKTAAALGEIFGITDLREDPQAVSGDHAVVVVLRTQYDEAKAAETAPEKTQVGTNQ